MVAAFDSGLKADEPPNGPIDGLVGRSSAHTGVPGGWRLLGPMPEMAHSWCAPGAQSLLILGMCLRANDLPGRSLGGRGVAPNAACVVGEVSVEMVGECRKSLGPKPVQDGSVENLPVQLGKA
jgi:hypothetical protein